MTDQASYPTYLEEAAEELRKAREDNEVRADNLAKNAGLMPTADLIAEVNNRRMEIAAAFTRLAAIEAGLPPCCHHVQPEQVPQP